MPEKIELFEYACKLFMEKEPSRASTLSLSSELCKASRPGETNAAPVDDSCVLMTVDQVMNGYVRFYHSAL